MDIFVILSLGFLSLVKCDVGIGYRYQVPVTSYDAPSGAVGNLNNDRKYYHIEKQPFASGSFAAVTPSSQLQTPTREHGNFIDGNLQQNNVAYSGGTQGFTQTRTGFDSSAHKESLSAFNLPISSQQRGGGVTLLGSPLKNNIANTVSTSHQNFATDSRSSFASQNSQQLEVQRHLYFYSAPEEPEEVRPRVIVPPASGKKNVKILFIKTPTYNTAPISIPALPQNEEKTLVYVLVKNPEASSIVLPTPAPAKPTKPEVYFIKYKSRKEAQDAIANIQQDQSANTGISAINSYDADSFARDFAPDRNVETNQFGGYNDNVNLISRTGDTSGSVSSEAPVLISTTTLSTPLSDSAGLHVRGQSGLSGIGDSSSHHFGGQSGVSGTGYFTGGRSGLSTIGDSASLHLGGHSGISGTGSFDNSQRVLSTDTGAGFGGRYNDARSNFESATTASSLNAPTVSIKGTEQVNIHQLYGPPQN